jgi:hypothetical protein
MLTEQSLITAKSSAGGILGLSLSSEAAPMSRWALPISAIEDIAILASSSCLAISPRQVET